jgi:hypothetical protein
MPTVAWTRAWLLQRGGGVLPCPTSKHTEEAPICTVPSKFAKRKVTVPSPAWLLIKGGYYSRGWGYTPSPQANIRIIDGMRACVPHQCQNKKQQHCLPSITNKPASVDRQLVLVRRRPRKLGPSISQLVIETHGWIPPQGPLQPRGGMQRRLEGTDGGLMVFDAEQNVTVVGG